LLGHAVLDKRIPPLWESRPDDFPLPWFVLDHATTLIVHSATVWKLVRRAGYERSIWPIKHPAWPVPLLEPERVADGPVVGCFGVVNASKRIPELLTAFARVRRNVADATLLLVGPTAPGFDVDRRLQRLGLDEPRLWRLMAGVDVCVNLRHPTMGETSGSAIRSLSLGKPLVVSDVGWFSELPSEVALKVSVDDAEVDALGAGLELLLTRPDLREQMGRAAAAIAAERHDLGLCAERYAAALEDAAGGSAVADAVLREVSRAAADVGIDPDAPEAREIARRLAEVDLR
jgi:glycosyltransferase involved in cell wall biosynthesis